MPDAPPTDPPLDLSTLISALNTKELRLYLEGEAPATLHSDRNSTGSIPASSGASIGTSSPSITSNSAPGSPSLSSGIHFLCHKTTSNSYKGRILKEGNLMKADNNKKMKKVWTTLDKNFIYCYKTPQVQGLFRPQMITLMVNKQDKNPTEKISLYCATPKAGSKKYTFDLLTVTNTYTFAADSEAEVLYLPPHCILLTKRSVGNTMGKRTAGCMSGPHYERNIFCSCRKCCSYCMLPPCF